MLYRIRVESEELNRQYHSDPAMYSTLTVPNKASFQLDIVLQASIFYMRIVYAVVIEHYMLYRIRVESEEFIHQHESDPAMFSTLPAPEVVIAHCILHRIRRSLHSSCFIEFGL